MVGSFPSPHLQHYGERIRINGTPAVPKQFEEIILTVKEAVEELEKEGIHPTQFEIITAAACKYFRDSGVDVLVAEVGLGGRDDSTNALDLGVKVITSIALDHQDFLGDSIESIAGHKVGIVRPGDDVVVGVVPPAAESAMRGRLDLAHRVFRAGRDVVVVNQNSEGVDIVTPYATRKHLRVPLIGEFQARNLALAVASVDVLNDRLGASPLARGQWDKALNRMTWPGRMEVLRGCRVNPLWTGDLILDGAHNPHALAAVISELTNLYPHGGVLIFGAMRDKVIADMLRLVPPEWPIVLSQVEGERSADLTYLASLVPQRSLLGVTAEVSEALQIASAAAAPHRPITVLGSLYLVGSIRDLLGLIPQ
jgi:dihydrofolate synthase/folylpolyglutamate synthase